MSIRSTPVAEVLMLTMPEIEAFGLATEENVRSLVRGEAITWYKSLVKLKDYELYGQSGCGCH
jgi:hypothetical protein